MKTTTIQLIIFITLFIMTVAPSVAFAQSTSVTLQAEAARESVYVGDSITFQIFLRGADTNTLPSIEFPDSVRGVYRRSGRQSFRSTRIVNGRQQQTINDRITFLYTITIIEPGKIIIPAATIRIGPNEYRSNAVMIESVLPQLAIEDRVELLLPRTTLYLNEAVPLDVTWWIGNINTSDFTLNTSEFSESVSLTPVETGFHGPQSFTLEIAGQRVIAVLDQTTIKGVEKARMRFRLMVTPNQVGRHTLGPIRIVFNRAEPNKRPYRAFIESEQVELTVIPLPVEGKPQSYDGAIGSYQLIASASIRSVNVGDPIELVVRISGNEPMPGITSGPAINQDRAFTDSFKVASEGWREDLPRKMGTRIYRTTIRATDATIDEIPPIQLSSFDTETGAYRVFRSNSIPIDVRAVKEITLADAIGSFKSNPPAATETEQSQLVPVETGLWAHAPIEGMLRHDGFDLQSRIRSPGWIATMSTGPLLACASLIAVRRRRRMGTDSAAIRRAWAIAKKLDTQGLCAQSIRTYLGAIIGCEPDSFSSNDLEAFTLDSDLRTQVSTLLKADEQSGFARSGDQQARPVPAGLLHALRRAVELQHQSLPLRRAS
ncbi:MAG: BatD family protein [Phycisphaerales bacterium]|nr:BatD family protein [Phycisphaerales bacterium]